MNIEQCRTLAHELKRKIAANEIRPEEAVAEIKAKGCIFEMACLAAENRLNDNQIKQIWDSL